MRSYKPQIEILTCTTTENCHTVKLNDELIKNMMRAYGTSVPDNATVEFVIPVRPGGDYSGTTIEVDGDCPVWVKWTETKVKDTRK